jgi:simple sugar transport system substrate-binding protein
MGISNAGGSTNAGGIRAHIRLLLVLLACMLPGAALVAAPAPLRVAFVHEHPVSAGGWSQSHDMGRRQLEQAMGAAIQTTTVEGVTPGPDTVRVLTRLARDGYDMIFATSFGHMNAVMKVAQQFPRTTFEHASGYKQARNVGTYQVRAYEGRYLAGRVAGAMTRTNIIGYIGAFPIPEVVRDINAFTRGVRAVNPRATVRVVWINTWLDPSKEREAAELLIAGRADVLTHHTETPAPMVAAEAAGVWAIGYQFDRSAFAPTRHLLTVQHNWLPIYRTKVQARRDGRWRPMSMWLGLKHDAVRLASLSPAIPASVRADVARARAGIIAGTLDIFAGPIKDMQGKPRIPAGGTLNDAGLLSVDWLVEGVTTRR